MHAMKNSPGKRRVVPYTNSEMVQFKSPFNACEYLRVLKVVSPSTALGVSESSVLLSAVDVKARPIH